jgi:DNA-binding protein H-NS
MHLNHSSFNIPDLPVSELEQMRQELDARIAEKRDSERVAAAMQVREIARKAGFSLQELIPLLKDEAGMPVKFRHPDHPDLTWCGKGRRPLWMNEAIDTGITLAKMRVDHSGSGSC